MFRSWVLIVRAKLNIFAWNVGNLENFPTFVRQKQPYIIKLLTHKNLTTMTNIYNNTKTLAIAAKKPQKTQLGGG